LTERKEKTVAFVSIRDLKVSFSGVQVLHGINIDIDRGETLGLVGESGCGKSVTWLAALGLLPGKTSVSGSVRVDGQELINAPRHVQEGVRGGRIAMIFQDPSSSLNPVKKVGPQIVESLSLHRGLKGQSCPS
jgi:peptide/nickel transport system ATP-binding protein